MRFTCIAAAALLAALLSPATADPNGPTPTGQHAALVERQINDACFAAMDAIYRGVPSRADEIADRLISEHPEDPRSWLIKARALRLDVPDQNVDRDTIRRKSKPILEILDRGEDAASALIDANEQSVAGHLYRGWIRMFKAQLHALSNEYWSAGRRSKAGKEDLDFVLSQDPGAADALMLEGTYLYFADILPGLVKVAQFIVRVPGGSLDGGLRYLEGAALRQGYGRIDARALIGVILFAFEGRLEDAIEWLDVVLTEYPQNVRILEPLAAIDLFFPSRVARDLAHLQEVVARYNTGSETWERSATARLQLYVTIKQLLAGRLPEARANLAALYANLPGEPDWLRLDVYRLLVAVQLMQGDQAAAIQIVESLDKRDLLRRKLSYATRDDATPSADERRAFEQMQPALRDLYAGDPAAAEHILRGAAPDAPFVHFYRGELELLRGHPELALPHFRELTRFEVESCWWAYASLAHVREAEIHAAMGDDDAAQGALRRMVDAHPVKDLIRHLARARKRYYENGRPGSGGPEHAAKVPGAPPTGQAPSR